MKPAFGGTTTAGNASQISDGAAGVLLMKRSLAEAKGYPIVAKYIACSTVGVPPEIMGVGPAYAIPEVLKRTGLTGMTLMCLKSTKLLLLNVFTQLNNVMFQKKIEHKRWCHRFGSSSWLYWCQTICHYLEIVETR